MSDQHRADAIKIRNKKHFKKIMWFKQRLELTDEQLVKRAERFKNGLEEPTPENIARYRKWCEKQVELLEGVDLSGSRSR